MSTSSSKSKSLKRLSLLQSAKSLPSPSSSSSFGSPSVASHRFDLPEQQPASADSAQPSPVSSVYSPTATARAESGSVKNARRQSSIYYVSQDRDADRARILETHFPTNERSHSASQHDNTSVKADSEAKDKRQSTGSVDDQIAPIAPVEKHADLLRFIAQKESKCLELRSQLATEEAELQALKRKWERIVSRGVKADPLTSLSSSDTESFAQGNMLIGLREGVQGVGRLLAQLGDIGTQSKESDHGHESNSSISTMITSSSTRLSQSSISSLGFASDGGSATCADSCAESIDTSASAKRHSISAPVRRRPYEPSSPGTPSPPMLTPQTPQSASFMHGQSLPSSRSHSTTSTQAQAKHMKRLSAAAGSFPPASSIPGVSVAPLASWVEDVGKRLIGQIISAPSDTTSSSSRRVSEIRSGASSPVVTSPTRTSQNRPRVIDLSVLDSPSLLEDDDGVDSQWAGMTTLSPDRPKNAPATVLPVSSRASNGALVGGRGSEKVSDDDGEEWNW